MLHPTKNLPAFTPCPKTMREAQWLMPVISAALRRLRQEEGCKSEASHGYIVLGFRVILKTTTEIKNKIKTNGVSKSGGFILKQFKDKLWHGYYQLFIQV